MRIKQCLMSFPVSVIGFICLLVVIVSWNTYLNNYQHKLVLKQLTFSAAMLKSVEAQAEQGQNKIVADRLSQLKQYEKNAGTINHFSQIASIFILIGSLLLGIVFFLNLNKITYKLNLLSDEIENIHQHGLDACNLTASFDDTTSNEIDYLATNLAQVITNFKQSNREKNGLLCLLQQSNQQLKQKLEIQYS